MDKYAYIVGTNQVIQFARDLRKSGIKLRRVQRGWWKVVYTSTLAPDMFGEDVYITSQVAGMYRIDIPELRWSEPLMQFDESIYDTRFRFRFRYGFGRV